MESFRFVHAADLHIDSPLDGLALPEEAPRDLFRTATRRAAEGLVDLCLSEEVDFLLLAGDLFDGDWRDYQTGLFLVRALARLGEAGIPVFLVRGNHDAASVITKKLRWPEHVHAFPAREAGTRVIEELGVAIHGRSYAKRETTEDLTAGYPAPVPGVVNLGLLHTSADGRPGHENYAPCRVETLANFGYDYWALGHVHAREILSRDPWIVFPGNTQGRHVRETGEKGALLVSVTDGVIDEPEFRPVDVVRWARLSVDLATARDTDDLRERVFEGFDGQLGAADGRTLAVRVELEGRSPLHEALVRDPERWDAEVRAVAAEAGGDQLWVEEVRIGTRPEVATADRLVGAGPVRELLAGLEDLRGSDEALADLPALFAALAKKLPREAREGPEGLDPKDPGFLREALATLEDELLPRLLEGREE